MTVLFPIVASLLSTNSLCSMSSKMGLCFFRFKPQKLTRAVWFSSPYSTSFNITSLTMYIRSLYELGEPDIFIILFSLLLACQVCDNSNHNITCVNISTSIYLLSLCLSLLSLSLCLSPSQVNNVKDILIICRHHIETPLAYGNAKFGLALSSRPFCTNLWPILQGAGPLSQ